MCPGLASKISKKSCNYVVGQAWWEEKRERCPEMQIILLVQIASFSKHHKVICLLKCVPFFVISFLDISANAIYDDDEK